MDTARRDNPTYEELVRRVARLENHIATELNHKLANVEKAIHLLADAMDERL